MKRMPVLFLLLTCATTSALNVKVGDKTIGTTVSQGGKTYISVEILRAAGLSVTVQGNDLILGLPAAAGGQNQVAALSGCVGQTLFNGVWRFKVLDIKAATVLGKPGWEVSAEIRNATPTALSLYDAGFTTSSGGSALYLADDTAGTTAASGPYDNFKKVVPAGAYNITAQFSSTAATAGRPPTKLLFLRESSLGSRLPYNTKDPSFRVDLTCTK